MATNYVLTSGSQQIKHWEPDGTLVDTLDLSNFGNCTHVDSDGRLYYFDTSNDEFVQLDQNLNEQWRAPLYGNAVNDIAEDDTHLYTGTTTAESVYKIAKSDGTIEWEYYSGENGVSGFSLNDNGNLWVGDRANGEGRLFLLDTSNGSHIEERTLGQGNIYGVIYHNGYLYFSDGANDYTIQKYDTADWTQEWSYFYNSTTGGNQGPLRMDSDGNLYTGGISGFASYDSTDGSNRWSVSTDGNVDHIGVHPDGVFVMDTSGSSRFEKYNHDGTGPVFSKSPHGDSGRWVTAYPNYDDDSEVWQTEVVKSATATKVASSSTMHTADGTATATGTATPVSSSSTPKAVETSVPAEAETVSATSTTLSPDSTGTASASATRTPVQSTSHTASGTGSASGTATKATISTTQFTADALVGDTATATKASGSATMFEAQGTRVATASTTKATASTTTWTAYSTNVDFASAQTVSASTATPTPTVGVGVTASAERTSVSGSAPPPTVTTTSKPTVEKVGATTAPLTAEQISLAEVEANKIDVSATTLTPFRFERRISSLQGSTNDSELTASRNDSELVDSRKD